ncbi:FAD-dependent oxidoreductase [Kamptonema cortianum]|nr:FAD-dependent oxidoreductase [Geitlerinema splendidum]MDK3162206.1 FAD-dependent oxidoreductase [Kamptonema cortianum]
MADKHIVIIGAGIVGLSTAYECLKRGMKVTVIERESEDHRGCSWGNAGYITPSHFVPLPAPGMVALGTKMMLNPEGPFTLQLPPKLQTLKWALSFARHCSAQHVDRVSPIIRDINLLAVDVHSEMAEICGIPQSPIKRGCMMLCAEEKTLAYESMLIQKAKELQLDARLLTAEEVEQMQGGMKVNAAGAVYFSCDADITPEDLMIGLKNQIRKGGGTIEYNTSVKRIIADPHGIKSLQVSHARGETQVIRGDHYVLAAGTWTSQIARDLHLEIPIVPGRGHSMTVTDPPIRPQIPMILIEGRVAITPMRHGVRFGGTMVVGGWKQRVSHGRVRGIIKQTCKVLPQFDRSVFKNQEVWTGLRPCSPDGLPLIGRPADLENCTIASGHAMMGLSLGPPTGRLVAQDIAGEPLSMPWHAFSPNRFIR